MIEAMHARISLQQIQRNIKLYHCDDTTLANARVTSKRVKWTEEGFGMQIFNVKGKMASLDPKHP